MGKSMVKVTSILALLALVVGMALPVMAATNNINETETILLNALHEERIAAATYQAIIDKFGEVEPFERILKAEQNHIAAVENLLKVNGISIPENTTSATAPETLAQAYELAVKIEKEDIELYQQMYPKLSDTMIKTVFTRLSNASKRHLEVFESYENGTPTSRYVNGKRRGMGPQDRQESSNQLVRRRNRRGLHECVMNGGKNGRNGKTRQNGRKW